MQAPLIAPASLMSWYDSPEYQGGPGAVGSIYGDYAADESHRALDARGRYRRDLEGVLPPAARVLEIGCASGSLLATLRERGYRVSGCDLSTRFAALARDFHGLDVAVADYLSLPAPPGAYDAVIMLGAISNMQDLPATLAKVWADLCPGGLFYFNFPAADGWLARVYAHRFWMFAPSVAGFMTRMGCRLALEAAGFRIERMSMDRQQPSWDKLLGHGSFEWLRSWMLQRGWGHRPLPMAVPLPGIYAVSARRGGRVR